MTSSHIDPEQLPRTGQRSPGAIVRVDDARRLEAVRRLVAGQRETSQALAERFIEFSRSNQIPIDAMWVRLDDAGRVRATVLGVPNPGRTAVVFSSAAATDDDVAPLAELIEYATGQLKREGVDLAQVLLEPHDRLQREAFLAGGFRILANLSYLERPLARPPADPHWPADVVVDSYQDSMESDLLEILEASYVDTLDCPGLRGLRRTKDILIGHRSTGEYDQALWTIVRVDGAPGGALLLNRSPASNTIELVYIGLAKAVQGRGIGRQLLRHGLQLITGRDERAITLAVDEQNEPAIRLYRSEGFRRVLRRIALIRPLPD